MTRAEESPLIQPAQREVIAPTISVETQPFWEAAAQGRFVLKCCTSCGRFHHYPRSICPFCMSDTTEWREASGGGVVHAFSVMRRVPVPYAVAYVQLDEGPLMLTNIVRTDLDSLHIGQRVRVAFDGFDGGALPVFIPA
ncbi:MAG: hypothetical protein RI988_3295 [Pseudomonadota bacterium]|jgi:uncharacterized OB-fold protein